MSTPNEIHPDDECLRLLRIEQVLELVPLPRSTLYYDIRHGRFPAPIKMGNKSLWLNSDIAEWLNEKKRERKPVKKVEKKRRNEDFI